MNHKILKLSILLGVLLLMALVIASRPTPALADVAVGDYIDSSNAQKIQGLVPDAVYEYVKKGWLKMKIGKLNYEPGDLWYIKEGEKRNKGKYDMTANAEILEKSTGAKDPLNIVGQPFPLSDLDPKDPHFGEKFFTDNLLINVSMGSHRLSATLYFLGDKYERKISGPQKGIRFVGTERSISNQKFGAQFGPAIQETFIMRVTDPYELNGLATMSYQYFDNTPDKVFAYVPALRRARVMTAAARSDSMFGTDYALDDAGCGWWGKPRNFSFKYIRTQDALVQYAGPDPSKWIPNPDGSISVEKEFASGKFGFMTPGWTGKPWALTNSIWVKRKVQVIEITAKDPYYNYGKVEFWGDAKTTRGAFKIINDRAGKRWKVMIMNSSGGVATSPDYPWGFPLCAHGDVIYDEQRNHATGIHEYVPGEQKNWNVTWDPADFTLGGLAKISK